MFISKDLNKKCFVVANITGKDTLDSIVDMANEILVRDGYIDSNDLYRIINPTHSESLCFSALFKQAFLKNPMYWTFDWDQAHRIFTLYIPYYDKGESEKCRTLKPHITPDISSIETYNDRVVLIRFKDGTFTKAVAMDKDPFDFDMLFTIAYMKRMLGEDGHKKYHKLIDKAHKIVKKQELEEEEQLRKKAEQKKRLERRARKKERKENKKNEQLGRLIFGVIVDALEYNSMHNTSDTEDDLK